VAAGASRGAADNRSTSTKGGCKFRGWSESAAGLGSREAGYGRALVEVGLCCLFLVYACCMVFFKGVVDADYSVSRFQEALRAAESGAVGTVEVPFSSEAGGSGTEGPGRAMLGTRARTAADGSGAASGGSAIVVGSDVGGDRPATLGAGPATLDDGLVTLDDGSAILDGLLAETNWPEEYVTFVCMVYLRRRATKVIVSIALRLIFFFFFFFLWKRRNGFCFVFFCWLGWGLWWGFW